MVLFLQDTNGTGQSINGLCVVGHGCLEVNCLLVTNTLSRFLILGPSANVLIKFVDAISELTDFDAVLLNLSRELIDLGLTCINFILLCAKRVCAPLIKSRELDFFL